MVRYCLERPPPRCLPNEVHSPCSGTEKLIKQPPAATPASSWPSPGPTASPQLHLTAHRLPQGHLPVCTCSSQSRWMPFLLCLRSIAVFKILLEISSSIPPNNYLTSTSDVFLKYSIINS